MKTLFLLLALTLSLGVTAQSHAPTTHRPLATPDSVSYGYYWSEAKPALGVHVKMPKSIWQR